MAVKLRFKKPRAEFVAQRSEVLHSWQAVFFFFNSPDKPSCLLPRLAAKGSLGKKADLPLSLKEGLSAIKRVPGYDGDDASAFAPTESSLWSCHEAVSMPVGFLKGASVWGLCWDF